MALDLQRYLNTADAALISQGLYTTITFVDVDRPAPRIGTSTDSVDDQTYDPISGTFVNEAEESVETSSTFTFPGVVLNTNGSNQPNNTYKVMTQVIVLPQHINFIPEIDQIYEINGVDWQVMGFSIAPQDSLYTFDLGRK